MYKEHFTVVNPFQLISYGWVLPLAIIIFSILLVFSVVTRLSWITFAAIIVLATLAFIIIYNARSANLAGSLPFATYPNPPHLGLDGVNLQNRAAARNLRYP